MLCCSNVSDRNAKRVCRHLVDVCQRQVKFRDFGSTADPGACAARHIANTFFANLQQDQYLALLNEGHHEIGDIKRDFVALIVCLERRPSVIAPADQGDPTSVVDVDGDRECCQCFFQTIDILDRDVVRPALPTVIAYDFSFEGS